MLVLRYVMFIGILGLGVALSLLGGWYVVYVYYSSLPAMDIAASILIFGLVSLWLGWSGLRAAMSSNNTIKSSLSE